MSAAFQLQVTSVRRRRGIVSRCSNPVWETLPTSTLKKGMKHTQSTCPTKFVNLKISKLYFDFCPLAPEFWSKGNWTMASTLTRTKWDARQRPSLQVGIKTHLLNRYMSARVHIFSLPFSVDNIVFLSDNIRDRTWRIVCWRWPLICFHPHS